VAGKEHRVGIVSGGWDDYPTEQNALGYWLDAIPRNTTMARLRRTTSASSRTPR